MYQDNEPTFSVPLTKDEINVAGKILQHAIWYLQSDIDPQRHFSLMPLLGIF